MISHVIILGASGDLVERLLLPGIGTALGATPDARVTIVGAGRSEQPEWPDLVRAAFESVGAAGDGYDPGEGSDSGATGNRAIQYALTHTRHEVADGTEAPDLARLLDDAEGPVCLYLSLPPAAAEQVVDALAQIGAPDDLLLALEKPMGTSVESARGIEAKLADVLPEERIYRVDHFLGMSGVLGLLGLRVANRAIEALLSAGHVERIEIVFDETLGLEGRADFYDGTGAAEDMIQSHLLQAMAVLMAELPDSLGAADLHAATSAVLRATSLRSGGGAGGAGGGDVGPAVVRGRYTAGTVDGAEMPDYVDEEGVDPETETETFARLVVEVDTPRWAGVPVILRSGKAIGEPAREIRVFFRSDGAEAGDGLDVVGSEADGRVLGTALVVGFEDGRIDLRLRAGDPTVDGGLTEVRLRTDDVPADATAYATVAHRLLRGDTTLSVAPDGPEQGWRVMAEMEQVIARGDAPLQDYAAGSDGPEV